MLLMHRLVQAVIQDLLGGRTTPLGRAIHSINAAFPNVEPATWPQSGRLLSHALLAAQWIKQYHIIHEDAGRVVYETAVYLRDHARYAESLLLMQHALAIFEQRLELNILLLLGVLMV